MPSSKAKAAAAGVSLLLGGRACRAVMADWRVVRRVWWGVGVLGAPSVLGAEEEEEGEKASVCWCVVWCSWGGGVVDVWGQQPCTRPHTSTYLYIHHTFFILSKFFFKHYTPPYLYIRTCFFFQASSSPPPRTDRRRRVEESGAQLQVRPQQRHRRGGGVAAFAAFLVRGGQEEKGVGLCVCMCALVSVGGGGGIPYTHTQL